MSRSKRLVIITALITAALTIVLVGALALLLDDSPSQTAPKLAPLAPNEEQQWINRVKQMYACDQGPDHLEQIIQLVAESTAQLNGEPKPSFPGWSAVRYDSTLVLVSYEVERCCDLPNEEPPTFVVNTVTGRVSPYNQYARALVSLLRNTGCRVPLG